MLGTKPVSGHARRPGSRSERASRHRGRGGRARWGGAAHARCTPSAANANAVSATSALKRRTTEPIVVSYRSAVLSSLHDASTWWLMRDHASPLHASACSAKHVEGDDAWASTSMSQSDTCPSSAAHASFVGSKGAHWRQLTAGGRASSSSFGCVARLTAATEPWTRCMTISPAELAEATCSSLGFHATAPTPAR